MNLHELEELWGKTLRSDLPTEEQFSALAQVTVDLYAAGDPPFTRHIQNRLKHISKRTGESYDTFDNDASRTVVADEMGFESWDDLVAAVNAQTETSSPILFQYTKAAMERGDFSALETTFGGPAAFDEAVIDLYEKGYFEGVPETLAEVLSAACMLGHERAAAYLLDKNVDPLAGTKTGLNGFHYAASSGRLGVINLLIERKVPMEIKNMYGGTVLEQALWSVLNEYTADHAAIIEALIEAGAVIEPGTLAWWNKQDVPSNETRTRVADALRSHGAT